MKIIRYDESDEGNGQEPTTVSDEPTTVSDDHLTKKPEPTTVSDDPPSPEPTIVSDDHLTKRPEPTNDPPSPESCQCFLCGAPFYDNMGLLRHLTSPPVCSLAPPPEPFKLVIMMSPSPPLPSTAPPPLLSLPSTASSPALLPSSFSIRLPGVQSEVTHDPPIPASFRSLPPPPPPPPPKPLVHYCLTCAEPFEDAKTFMRHVMEFPRCHRLPRKATGVTHLPSAAPLSHRPPRSFSTAPVGGGGNRRRAGGFSLRNWPTTNRANLATRMMRIHHPRVPLPYERGQEEAENVKNVPMPPPDPPVLAVVAQPPEAADQGQNAEAAAVEAPLVVVVAQPPEAAEGQDAEAAEEAPPDPLAVVVAQPPEAAAADDDAGLIFQLDLGPLEDDDDGLDLGPPRRRFCQHCGAHFKDELELDDHLVDLHDRLAAERA